MHPLRLGVNIDHVATLRNARGSVQPDPLRAAMIAADAGADGITAHLREDRRHIRDDDIARLKALITLPLNLEMAATEEMRAIALHIRPNAVCIVPEKRQEITTEGGLDVVAAEAMLRDYIVPLKAAGIRISLFVDSSMHQLHAASRVGADIVELHTGAFCRDYEHGDSSGLANLRDAAGYATAIGLECHAGHGLSFESVMPVAAIKHISELNIGHFIIANAVFDGLAATIRAMKQRITAARV